MLEFRHWLCLWVCSGWFALAQAAGLVITDDRGNTVSLSVPPQRVVTLLPSLTETVCALGQCDRIVGTDRHSNWPERVQRVPKLGSGLEPSVEAIVALRPDIVLAGAHTRASARLQALGLNVLVFEHTRHADVLRVLVAVGRVLGLPGTVAEQVWQEMQAGLSAAAASLPSHARGASVYVEVNQGPYAAGDASFIGETLKLLGARNIVGSGLGPFPRLNPEFVVRSDPDVIMAMGADAAGMADRPGWRSMRAMRERRWCLFSPAEADVLVRPGPRMAEAARLMAECLGRLYLPGATVDKVAHE
jgi:iron complex transport system substrate-binding protein